MQRSIRGREDVHPAPRIGLLRDPHTGILAAEIGLLVLWGCAAAITVGFVKLGLRIPGHAIVLAALPMALGYLRSSLRLAGTVMGAAAFGTAAALDVAGLASYGTGSFTSLCLLGPLMDIAVVAARRGWRIYVGLVSAGILANLLALASRSGGKLLGIDGPGTRPMSSWWSQASITYVASGAVAGLICALVWHHSRGRLRGGEPESRA